MALAHLKGLILLEHTPIMIPRIASKTSFITLSLILLVIFLRLTMMSNVPLMDTTEARYGELSRVTAIGHYWLMPHMTAEQPFFAKPPLSFWFSAGSWLAFGQNEFALRLPSLLLVLLSCLALFYAAQSFELNRRQWTFASFVLLSTPIGFISAGAVMTEGAQLAIISWAMAFLSRILLTTATQKSTKKSAKVDLFGFWIVLGLGAITKGLATWALIGLPVILFWVFSPKSRIMPDIKKIWFWPGIAFFVLIVLAWYVPAEIYYPGFLRYFIVGEHFDRFLDPGWKGDMYGTAHSEAIGMIWVFWILSIAIWFPMFVRNIAIDRPLINTRLSDDKKWLWAWTLAPLLFFTFSRNIIWTYTLTALPAFAILVAKSWPLLSKHFKSAMQWAIAMWLILATFAALVWIPHEAETRSARKLVHEAMTIYPDLPVYSYGAHEFSISYYSQGRIHQIKNKAALAQIALIPNTLIILSSKIAKKFALDNQAKIIDNNTSHSLLLTNHSNQ